MSQESNEDTAIPLGRTVFIPRFKEKSRRGEVNDVRDFFSAQGYRIVYGKGFMDGGDVVFLGRNNYLVGLSERTNVKGAKSFVKIAEKLGFNVCLVQVPKTTLHLSTILSSPTPGTIVTADLGPKRGSIRSKPHWFSEWCRIDSFGLSGNPAEADRGRFRSQRARHGLHKSGGRKFDLLFYILQINEEVLYRDLWISWGAP